MEVIALILAILFGIGVSLHFISCFGQNKTEYLNGEEYQKEFANFDVLSTNYKGF